MRLLFLFLLPITLCFARTEEKLLVAAPVVDLLECPSDHAERASQLIYGEVARRLASAPSGFIAIETDDGYQGYAVEEAFAPDDPRWRTSQRLAKVVSVAGIVYAQPDFASKALLKLPFGARIELTGAESGRWRKAQLIGGAQGWIQMGDVAFPEQRSVSEIVILAHQFLERPYIWGGTSSEGYDCSGFVQTLYKETGRLLPRDSHLQSTCEQVDQLSRPEQPGDLLFFGEGRVTHVALYLGEGRFIHAGMRDGHHKVQLSELGRTEYNYLFSARPKEIAYRARITPVHREMVGASWQDHNPIPLDELRHIALNHWGFDGCVHDGELIVHGAVADEVVEIFGDLFAARYPIERVALIDAYGASDDLSCADNSSYAFCLRPITGSQSEWSYHSLGLAIDINPLLNPYQRGGKVVPKNGAPFLDRTLDCRGLIVEDDPCYKAFSSRGWLWGGHLDKTRGYVNYQHFYKERVEMNSSLGA